MAISTAVAHLAAAPSMPLSSIFQPWGMNAPKKVMKRGLLRVAVRSRRDGPPLDGRLRPPARLRAATGLATFRRAAAGMAAVVGLSHRLPRHGPARPASPPPCLGLVPSRLGGGAGEREHRRPDGGVLAP